MAVKQQGFAAKQGNIMYRRHDKMKKRILSIFLIICVALCAVPYAAFADTGIDLEKRYNLKEGETYYFDLSSLTIPGTKNQFLPDKSLHYVPFTYTGIIDAYELAGTCTTAEETEAYAKEYAYKHPLFISDFRITDDVSWNELSAAKLIYSFEKEVSVNNLYYWIRTPSVGARPSDQNDGGFPSNNEWDVIRKKNSGYIKSCINSNYASWGQDYADTGYSNTRAIRGYSSNPITYGHDQAHLRGSSSFCPVLEFFEAYNRSNTKIEEVTLNLGEGKLGEDIRFGNRRVLKIIVNNDNGYKAPTDEGFIRPENSGNYFMWLGSDNKLYAPGETVPPSVKTLTAQWTKPEQFSLSAGQVYYFDLSGETIPGTINADLPDPSLHYTPFVYTGTIDSYKLDKAVSTDAAYAKANSYIRSLFVSDYYLTHSVSWNTLNSSNLIFGKSYSSAEIDYQLRAPSAGSNYTTVSSTQSGTPSNNDWDTILNKDPGYIRNFADKYAWGQDSEGSTGKKAARGNTAAGKWSSSLAAASTAEMTYRPVLEVSSNPNDIGKDGLKAVTVHLNGGKLGGSKNNIKIIVKNGSSFKAPSGDGLTRPDGNTDSFFIWRGDDNNLYYPGETVPYYVTMLVAQWERDSYSVSYDPGIYGTGEIQSDNKLYDETLTLKGKTFTRAGYTQIGWTKTDGSDDIDYALDATYTDNAPLSLYPVWQENSGYKAAFRSDKGELLFERTYKWTDKVLSDVDTPSKSGWDFLGWISDDITLTADTTFADLAKNDDTRLSIDVIEKWKDTETPTGEVKIGDYSWLDIVDGSGNKLYFNQKQTVTVTAADNSGKVNIGYLISNERYTKDQLEGKSFEAYDKPFEIAPESECIVYVRLSDDEGNRHYISTNNIVLDSIAPKIVGVQNGETYCEQKTFTITENNLHGVIVNQQPITPDQSGNYTLAPADHPQKIAVYDKAGNVTEITVTVNDGHTYEWQSENGEYWQKCKFCGSETEKKAIPTIAINGADKVCRTQDYSFSFEIPENCRFIISGYEFENVGSEIDATENNGVYTALLSAGEYPADESGFNVTVTAETADGFVFQAEKAVGILDQHIGGVATCTEKAKCDVCGEPYGELDGDNHSKLTHVDPKPATEEEFGNIEYWYCEGCDKYYADENAEKEIKKEDTIIDKLTPKEPDPEPAPEAPDDKETPFTGTAVPAVSLAALLLSGGALIVTASGRRKKK